MDKLYWARGTAAFAPHAVLEEAGATYEIVVLDLEKGEHQMPEYLALNPAGYVPTLVTGDGQVLTESAAITVALCERHAEAGLIPEPGAPGRDLFFCWLFYLAGEIQKAYKPYHYPQRFSTEPADAPNIRAQARRHLIDRWRIVEDRLADPSPFLLGSRFTAADIFLVMLATWFEPMEELLAQHPNIRRCFDLAAARPALRRVLASHGEP
jgi:glutathione S-transferase